jgi:PTS system mannose-specific IIB component/fructoselysine and glucoselysine-specific PTS system IIB component
MPIQLFRVDERLIHGQVVIGWGSHLAPQRYAIVDDDVAESGWEQELYALGLPDGTAVEFVTVEQAGQRIPEWQSSPLKTIVLARDLRTVHRLAEGGYLDDIPVNLGGIHHGAGRTQVLSYIYLDDEDRRLIRELAGMGVAVTARDLPGSRKVGAESLLR